MRRATPRNEASKFETRYILLQHFTAMKFIIVDLLHLLYALAQYVSSSVPSYDGFVCFHVHPVFCAFFLVGLEGCELGIFGLTGCELGIFGLAGFEIGTLGLAGLALGIFELTCLGLAGFGLWGLELDVSPEGFLFSGGGYSCSGRSTSLEFVIPGNRLTFSFTVVRSRPLIALSVSIIEISCAVGICCAWISAMTGTLFAITAKLMAWPF